MSLQACFSSWASKACLSSEITNASHHSIYTLIYIYSPILYRTFYLLTPPSELPPLPQSLQATSERSDVSGGTPPRNPSYLPIHLYTLLQIVVTVVIFIVTLTRGAPAFPILIIALVPFRLLVMKRWWPREVLRFVDAWACREGTPEDDEDVESRKERQTEETPGRDSAAVGDVFRLGSGGVARSLLPVHESSATPKQHFDSHPERRVWDMVENTNYEWVELRERNVAVEELGHR